MLPKLNPTLADESEQPPEGAQWVYEIKYDGVRVLAYKEGGKTTLINRSGNNITSQFPAIAEAVSAIPGDEHVLDGEIVVFDDNGISRLDMVATKLLSNKAVYVAFDMPIVNGRDMRQQPLTERRSALVGFVGSSRLRVKLAERIPTKGTQAFEKMMKRGMEGLIAKDSRSFYTGTRYNRWVKVKCYKQEQFDVIGYTPSDKREFAALLLSRDGEYVGTVGSGLTAKDLSSIAPALQLLRTTGTLPRKTGPMPRESVMVGPGLVVMVQFLPGKRHLRFPVFLSVGVSGASNG